MEELELTSWHISQPHGKQIDLPRITGVCPQPKTHQSFKSNKRSNFIYVILILYTSNKSKKKQQNKVVFSDNHLS